MINGLFKWKKFDKINMRAIIYSQQIHRHSSLFLWKNDKVEMLRIGVEKNDHDKKENKNDCIILSTLEELVPKENLVRKLDNCINFTFIEELVSDLYSIRGRPSIPPVVLFKLIFINIVFGDGKSLQIMALFHLFC